MGAMASLITTPHDCLLNHLFRRGSKKTSKFRVTAFCAGNSLVTGEFPAQMASNEENVYISWRHNDLSLVDISYSSGPLFTQGRTSQPKILGSLEAAKIRLWHFHSLWNPTAMHLGSSTAEMPVQFQNDTIITASRGFEIFVIKRPFGGKPSALSIEAHGYFVCLCQWSTL